MSYSTGIVRMMMLSKNCLLDNVENLRVVYSFRKLTSSYAGPIVQIYRLDDAATKDFYAGACNFVSSSEILAWLDGSAGYVSMWYDQSGNGYHATQPISTKYPLFDDNAVNFHLPGAVFSPADDTGLYFDYAAIASLSECTTFVVSRISDSMPAGDGSPLTYTTPEGVWGHRHNASVPAYVDYRFGLARYARTNALYDLHDDTVVSTVADAGSPIRIYVDGVEAPGYTTQNNALALPVSVTDSPAIGQRSSSGTSLEFWGPVAEIIIVGEAMSDESRADVESNMTSIYTSWSMSFATSAGSEIARIGIFTDAHFAPGKPPYTDRYYMDAPAKLSDAITTFDADPSIDLIVELGDTINGDAGQAAVQLAAYEAIYSTLVHDRYYCIGNHCVVAGEMSLAQFQSTTDMPETGIGYYTIEVGSDVLCIVLDAQYGDIDGGGYGTAYTGNVPRFELDWLESAIQSTDREHICVFVHQVVYSTAPGVMTNYGVTNNEMVRELLERVGREKQKIIHVFTGHRHETDGELGQAIYHRTFEAVVTDPYPSNAYAIVKIYDNGWVEIDGYGSVPNSGAASGVWSYSP